MTRRYFFAPNKTRQPIHLDNQSNIACLFLSARVASKSLLHHAAGCPHVIPERLVSKRRFDDILAVIEGTVYTNAVDVRVGHCSHLPLLNRAHSAFRKHDEAVDVFLSPKPVDSSRACASPKDGVSCIRSLQRQYFGISQTQLIPQINQPSGHMQYKYIIRSPGSARTNRWI